MSQPITVQDLRAVGSNYLAVTAAATLNPSQEIVDATVNGASYTLTLPPVASCRGRFYDVRANVLSAHALTLADNNDSLGWSDLTLDTDEDFVVLYSNGRRWAIIQDGIA